nr:MAG TPA: hypothetical protein [Caudoviricetes sp.]
MFETCQSCCNRETWMKRQVVHNHVKLQRLIRADKLSKYQFALRVNAHAACS